MSRVWVAMSGGVDSSVAAALLVEAGHDVTGVTMRLLAEDSPGGCCPSGSVRDAKRVAGMLGVPHYTLDMRDVFDSAVVEAFCDEYAAGRTPNPCIACNDVVKYGELLRRAVREGAEYLATGHYARVALDSSGSPWLRRGADPEKDQSYFLYRMTPAQLASALFPVGEMTKTEVRAIAAAKGLPNASRPESQEACFVPGDVRDFVRAHRPEAFLSGSVVDASGTVLGVHDGAVGFTIGQRRGVGIGGGERRYVTGIRPSQGTIVVGDAEELLADVAVADHAVWRGTEEPRRVVAQVRYRGAAHPATARLEGGRLVVRFDRPVDSVAPGQAVVCWDGDILLGGGEAGEG